MKKKQEVYSNKSNNDIFERVVERRLARRNFLKGATAAAGILVINPVKPTENAQTTAPQPLTFTPIQLSEADTVTVAPNYISQVVIKWGDPLFPGVQPFNPDRQTPELQARQFGYNCDFVGLFPFPRSSRPLPKRRTSRGLLVVNHEYTDPINMFRNYTSGQPTREQVDIELAAHGLTVVELEYGAVGWSYKFSRYNRRITGETEILITGPAAGHELMKTSYDLSGARVRGTINNCSAGKTPWGTVLTCEENFNNYFANKSLLQNSDRRKAIHTRYGLPESVSWRYWERFHNRFDLSKEPNEPFRFGWVVEIDPFDPHSTPRKLTALGRIKHEAATTVISPEGFAVVYSGDDEQFEYIYKFISEKKYNPGNRQANIGLLDSGTLYVAKFNDDGTGQWIPLVAGHGPLANWTQAEICIDTRSAADLTGATKMDRPEDIEINPVNSKLYCIMSNNTARGATNNPGTNKANPRANNRHGHIIELTEDGNNPSATTFNWGIFCLCGDPNVAADGTYWAGWQGSISPISSPDNLTFDAQGNMWIATDGQPGTLRKNDGIYAVPVDGPQRGWLRQFMSGPVGAEICGPEFAPDNLTLFCAIQHPGEGGTINNPTSLWPDGVTPPRPSVIAIQYGMGSRVIGI